MGACERVRVVDCAYMTIPVDALLCVDPSAVSDIKVSSEA